MANLCSARPVSGEIMTGPAAFAGEGRAPNRADDVIDADFKDVSDDKKKSA